MKKVVIKMIKFAICDDDTFMIHHIADQITQYMRKKQLTQYGIEKFSDSSTLLESDCDFDCIFLDIQMQEPNGMETAKILRDRNCNSLLIFVTVLKEYVFDAFSVEAFDYLVKPVEAVYFNRMMDRAMRQIQQRSAKTIVIQKANYCAVIALSHILYCEIQGRKLYIHQSDGTVIDYYYKLEDFEKQVDCRFFRCHRSYLVNLDYVKGYQDGQIMLIQGNIIPVSRLRKNQLTHALLRHMKERKLEHGLF